MTLVARVCEVCTWFPCRCQRETDGNRYIEADVRVERCACGGMVTVYGDQEPGVVVAAVRAHNATTRHQLWRRP